MVSRARRSTRRGDLGQLLALALLVVATLAWGLTTGSAYQLELLTNIALFVTLAYSLNALSGFTGYISFGQVAFFGFGAFATTELMIHAGFPWYLAAPAAGLASGLVAVPVGLVMLRLRGIYFALGMFGLVALLALVAARWDFTGGGTGLVLPGELAQGEVFVMMVVLAVAGFGLNAFMSRSTFGLRAMSIRDDEDVAEAMGVRTMLVKVTVFALSAILPAIAGGLIAFNRSFIDSTSAFDARIDLQTLLFVIAGGIGTLWGPFVGAVSLEVVGEQLWTTYPEVQLAIFGGLIVLITIFLRGGLVSVFNRFGLLCRAIVKVPATLEVRDRPPPPAGDRDEPDVLECRNLEVRFGGVKALAGVDVSVRRGEILCIIGANGAGKTTLFNAITGAVRPSGGEIVFDGEPIAGVSQHELARRGLGRTFQIPRPFELLTVWENILLAALGGRRRKDAVAQAAWVVRVLDLEDIWLEPVATLPIGHRRLVELARALALAPKVILLDEVMAGMSDAELERVRDVILRMPSFGVGAVAGVEHVIKAITDLADRVVVLDGGVKIADGPPDETLRRPEVIRAYLGEEIDSESAERVRKAAPERDPGVALEVTDLTAGYGGLGVLEDVSLTVAKDEIVSVLGANGAGKTTLLRAIAGLIRPTGGTIELHGDRIDGRPAHALTRAGIGHVPSGRALFPDLSVGDNLLLGGVGSSRERSAELRERVLELFPVLGDVAGRRAGALSGGQQQMLAIGRALMTDPKLLLLDEPSTGLAPSVVASLLDALRRLIDEGDLSILLIEQNASLGLGLAERAYVLQQGRCVLSGEADELKEEGLISAYLS